MHATCILAAPGDYTHVNHHMIRFFSSTGNFQQVHAVVPLTDDGLIESDETFFATLRIVSHGVTLDKKSATITIISNE